MKIRRKLQSFLNLAPSSTASLDLPLGMSYHGILLKLAATGGGATFINSDISRVRLMLNGKAIIRDIPGSVIYRDNLFRGSVTSTAYLYLDFEEPRAKSLADQYATLVHTAEGVNSFKLELDIASSAVGTLDITTWAVMSSTGLALGPIPALIKESFDTVAAAVREYTPAFKVGPQGPGHILRCIHLIPSQAGSEVAPSTVLGSLGVTLRKSGIPIFDRVTDAVNRWAQQHYEDVPQTNLFSLDWAEDNSVGINLMPTADASDMVFEIDIGSATATNWSVYYRMISTLDRL